MKDLSPPRIAESLLEKVLPAELVDPIMGDLEEEFQDIQISKNKIACQMWYWRQALSTSFYYFNHTQKVLIMFVFSVLFFVALTVFAMMLSGNTSAFIDLPSLIITLPPAIVFTVAVTSVGSVKEAFSSLLSSHAESIVQIKQSVKVFEVLGTSCLWLGAIMTVLGWVAMGAGITEPAVFGPAFAVSVLTLLYAMAVKLVCYVAQQRLLFLGQGLTPNTL